MDFAYPESAEATRAEVQRFLADNLPDGWTGVGALTGGEREAFVTEWRAKLYEGGWLGLSWPVEYGGGGRTAIDELVLAEELTRAGVPLGGPNDIFSIHMLGNTLLMWGTEEQKQHFLPRALSGEDVWCQGYSEPDAGSDLANVGAKAVLDGDEWIINGQKIWTSAGHLANWIFLIARTEPDLPKHRGLSFLLVPMDQAGVEVRAIKMMSGPSEFNETFFADARTPKEHIVGNRGDGWRVAMTLLGFERGKDAATAPIGFGGEVERLFDLAREHGRAHDPLIRKRLVEAYERVEVMRFMGYRALTKFMAGDAPGPDAAVTKIFWSEHHRTTTELAMEIMGTSGLVPVGEDSWAAFRHDAKGAPNSTASWNSVFQNARAGTIYAGTSEIQRGIIGEMMLGLPKEPKAG